MAASADEAAVLAANEAFYAAFRARDFAAMEAAWSAREEIVCIHPGWTPLWGRQAVLGSWARILANPGNPQLVPRNPKVILMGDAACVLCLEAAADGVIAATNVFAREDGLWRMVSHHGAGIAVGPEPDAPAPRHRGPLH